MGNIGGRVAAAAALVVVGGAVGVAQADVIKVNRAKSGSTVRAHRGDVVEIRLGSCAPCGYAWKLERRPSSTVMKLLSARYVAPPAQDPPVAGASGTKVYRYRVVGRGTTSLRAGYRGPSGQSGGRFTLTVRGR